MPALVLDTAPSRSVCPCNVLSHIWVYPYIDSAPDRNLCMSWCDDWSSPSLADRLVTACFSGDLPSAAAAVAEGASVNEKGVEQQSGMVQLPLTTAVDNKHLDVVVWLLSSGADSNGENVMYYGASTSTADILQLLIDAGGNVNRNCGGWPPLDAALWGLNYEDNVQVLLGQPSLDVLVNYKGKTPEQYARDYRLPALADVIAQEVSDGLSCGLNVSC